ncbi:MAG: tetratricopeptide repeat protein [bacterium]
METVEIDPSSRLLTDSGLHYFRLGNYPEAIKRFIAALESSRDKIQLYRYLGEANCRIRDYKQMAEWFRKVVAFYPSDLKGWEKLAIAYEALGQKSLLAIAQKNIREINRDRRANL